MADKQMRPHRKPKPKPGSKKAQIQKSKVWYVQSYHDYIIVAEKLQQLGVLGNDKKFGVLIGCSGHSVIQAKYFEEVVKKIGEEVVRPNNLEVLWGGGDPEKRGNVADLKAHLIKDGYLKYGACFQRAGHMTGVPEFEEIVIGYPDKFAMIENRKTFGGYVERPPDFFLKFLPGLTAKATNNKDLLPPTGVYPIGATLGYMMIFPCLASSGLILIVIPRAGTITLQELKYVERLLSGNPKANVQVYGINWNDILDLKPEDSKRCRVKDILELLQNMHEKFPDKVHLI